MLNKSIRSLLYQLNKSLVCSLAFLLSLCISSNIFAHGGGSGSSNATIKKVFKSGRKMNRNDYEDMSQRDEFLVPLSVPEHLTVPKYITEYIENTLKKCLKKQKNCNQLEIDISKAKIVKADVIEARSRSAAYSMIKEILDNHNNSKSVVKDKRYGDLTLIDATISEVHSVIFSMDTKQKGTGRKYVTFEVHDNKNDRPRTFGGTLIFYSYIDAISQMKECSSFDAYYLNAAATSSIYFKNCALEVRHLDLEEL